MVAGSAADVEARGTSIEGKHDAVTPGQPPGTPALPNLNVMV